MKLRGARSVWSVLLLTLGFLAICQGHGLAGEELLSNPGFEVQAEEGLPPGWQIFGGDVGQHLCFEQEQVYDGQWAFAVHDDDPSRGFGIRSDAFPAKEGQVYRASVMTMTAEGGRAYLYLDYWGADKKRISHKSVAIGSPSWTEMVASMEAPAGTVWVSVIIYSSSTDVGIARFDNASLKLVSDDVWAGGAVDLVVDEGSLDYAPADGAVVTTNPPSFVWIPVPGAASYALEYSTDPAFGVDKTTVVEDIDISIYTPSVEFDNTQTWYWRVWAVDRRGNASSPTEVRAFNVDADAASLALPPLDTVRAKLPKTHPRLFVTSETLDEWRQKSKSDLLYKLLWSNISTSALSARFAVLPDEPPHCRPGGVWDVNLWRQYTITTKATNTMETLAFAYMMTGDKETGEAARRWMLHVASWDPRGATSAAVNDESSMPILYQMSRAYTWAHDALTPEDRQVILDVMRYRGNEAYQILRRRNFENRPYASHAGRSLGFLGEAAIAFMGEIPEATEWFDYVVRVFYAIYPAWGKDPGGWAEGHAYWTSYMNRVLWFVDALREATGLDLYQKAFFQNTGTFKLYTQPPYSKMGPFGDFADRGPVTSDGSVMAHLAAVYGNPYYKWYANRLGAIAEMGVMGYIRAMLHDGRGVQAEEPTDLPPSAYFSDIGWTVFHRQLGDAKDGIQFMFKSSPYGSYSHSFADQNTFTLEAYGEPLAISSGYRPWYGSEHHMKWTKTTQAHNGLLVNGRGQQPQSLSARGQIIGFLSGDSFDYTAGDAQEAYGKVLLERYVRHAVYVRPDVFVLFDDLLAPQASTFSWLLHTYHAMDIDQEKGHIRFEADKAALDTYLWSDRGVSYSQTDEFATPLDEPMNKPKQWHLTATTQQASPEAYFLAVLAPSKSGAGRDLRVTPVDAGAGEGVRLQEGSSKALVLFRRGQGELAVGECASDGVAAAWSQHKDGEYGLLMAEGTSWRSEFGLQLSASATISAEMSIDARTITGTVVHPAVPGSQPYELLLQLPGQRSVKAVASSHELIDWQMEGDVLTLTLAPGEHKLTITFD